MAIDYTVSEKNDYILVKASGYCTSAAEMLKYVDDFRAKCDTRNQCNIVLDHRDLDLEMEETDNYDVALGAHDRISADKTYRVAVVTRPERTESARLFQSVGREQGLTLKVFLDREMAAAWLLT